MRDFFKSKEKSWRNGNYGGGEGDDAVVKLCRASV